jgi:catechol 2,3-dioxygenase-like lactoylglutathione lyase family enzyme
MPQLNRVLETALYADDLQRAASFYADVLGLRRLFVDARLQAFAVGGRSVLVSRRGASLLQPPRKRAR